MVNCSKYILKEMYFVRIEAFNDIFKFIRLVIYSFGSKS